MALSSLGVGSGLDLNGIVTSLMEVEQQPLQALKKKQSSYQSRISALGTLKNALSGLQTAAQAFIPATNQSATDKFATLKATTGDNTLLTASASTGAAAATYMLTDISLATAQQIRKTGLTIPTATNGSGDGSLSIKVGTADAVNVSVKGGSTLAQVAKAINDVNTAITASVVNDGSVDYLVFSAKESGASKQISITSTDNDGNAGTNLWSSFNFSSNTANGWTEQQQAASASVKVNGLLITSETNTISKAISNVSFTLVKESTAGTTLTVSKDTTATLTSAINGFIKAYNEAATSMRTLGAYNPNTKIAGALQGDSTLRGAQSQVTSLLQGRAGGNSVYQTLSNIGIALQKDGSLALDSSMLNKAIEADYAGVSNLVATIGSSFKTRIDGLIGSSGSIISATENANRLIKDLDKRQDALNDRLAKIEDRYRKQFSALDTLVAKMNQTSSWLSQQLANLPGASS